MLPCLKNCAAYISSWSNCLSSMPTAGKAAFQRKTFSTLTIQSPRVHNRLSVTPTQEPLGHRLHAQVRHFGVFSKPPAVSIDGFSSRLCAASSGPLVAQLRTLKLKNKIKKRCDDCYFVKWNNKQMVLCKKNPRHGQIRTEPNEQTKWIIKYNAEGIPRLW